MIQPAPNSPPTPSATKPKVPPPPATQTATTSSAKTSTTTKSPPPPSASPVKPKGGFLRRLMWRLLFLCILLGGGGYYAYQQPTLKPYVKKIIAFADTQINATKTTPPVKTTDNTANSARITKPQQSQSATQSPTRAAQSVQPAIQPPSSTTDALTQKFAALQNAVAQLQIDRGAINNRIEKLTDARAIPAELKLDLIDLRLRQTGDTNTAAESLLDLQNAADINQQWLAAEITRLQNAAAKNKIAGILQMLLRTAKTNNADNAVALSINAAADSSVFSSTADFLVSIFNIHRTSADNEDSATDVLDSVFNIHRKGAGNENRRQTQVLQRMELLFLAGQRAAYLAELKSLADRPPAADPNRALQIQTLQKYGAPIYALNMDSRQ